MGGNVRLGYDVHEKRLVPNLTEAERVRQIFEGYLRPGVVRDLHAELRKNGVVSKGWVSAKGSKRGGTTFSRGALYYLLRSAITWAWEGQPQLNRHLRCYASQSDIPAVIGMFEVMIDKNLVVPFFGP